VVTAPGAAIQGPEAVSQLRAFAAALQSSHELYNVLTTPSVPSSRKKSALAKIGGVLGFAPVTRNFLFVLVDHHRITAFEDILDAFELVLDERLGFARAEVSSARELSEAQRSIINSKLEHMTGKRIRMRFQVDESIIGGVIARIGSTLYDGSVRGQLSSLGRRLSAEE